MGIARDKTRTNHHIRIGSVGAGGNRGNHHIAMTNVEFWPRTFTRLLRSLVLMP